MTARQWIPTFLLLAAVALLPTWLVGCAALGAALGLWFATRPRPRADKPAPAWPDNVIPMERRNGR